MVRVNEPVVVVGDVHGQYYDLVTLIEQNAEPENTNYLFLGDYVDRGKRGLEILILLLAIKVNYKCN